MTVQWFDYTCTKVLRDGTSWEEVEGFIEDKTRSGKTKRRIANSMSKRPFVLSMNFTKAQYDSFHTWYETVCKKGLYSFLFPKIDNSSTYATYRFAKGGAPKYSNPSGKIIKCTMKWEEV